MNKKRNFVIYVQLHFLFMLYSLGGVCSKIAAQQKLFSWKWIGLYGIILVNLFFYAICWQQILKKLPLINAYTNKAVTVIWGIIWGKLLFNETITTGKVIGAILLGIGIYLIVSEEIE